MKLGALPIIMIGVAVSIVMLSYALFDNYLPNKTEAGYYRDYKVKLEAESAKRKQAEKRVKDANALVNQTIVQWKEIVASRTPPTDVAHGGIDLGVNPWQFVDDAKKFRNSIQIAVNQQVKKGGVKLPNGGPLIPAPGPDQATILANFFNYPAVAFPVVVFDLGQITVTGTYDEILANYTAWSKMPRYMVLVDGLQFTGTTPHMTATYSVQLLGYIRATDIFPPEPSMSLAAAMAGAGAPKAGGGRRGGGTKGG